MLNHQAGALRWYTGGHAFLDSMNGRWIPFKVVHNGPTRDIEVCVEDKCRRYKADETVKDFHFKFGVYGKQVRNEKPEKFEASFKDIKVTITKADVPAV
jgi:hypothetical protein